MKLADWMFSIAHMTPQELQVRLGIKYRSTVYRWLTGERIPSKRMIQKIIELTEGNVQLADFLDPEPPECFGYERIADGNRRPVTPWSDRDGQIESAYREMLRSESVVGPSAQELRAFEVLGPRVRRGPRDQYFLDGRPSDLQRIIKAANELLKIGGVEQIQYPGVCSIVQRRRRGSTP